MEKVEFKGDNPSARFGHTITPIGKDKAILFGGAVGDTGILHHIQVNTSSLVTPFSATIALLNGKSSKIMECLQPIAQHIVLYLLTTFSMCSEVLLEADSLPTITYINWISLRSATEHTGKSKTVRGQPLELAMVT